MSSVTHVLPVHYGCYYLMEVPASEEDGGVSRIFSGNTLIASGHGHAVIMAGTHTGNIRLTIETCDTPPPADIDNWEVVAEVNYLSPSGDAKIIDWNGCTRDEFRRITMHGEGSYRIRAHVRGRDIGHALDVTDEPVEEHLLFIWPAPSGVEIVHKVEDKFGIAHYRH